MPIPLRAAISRDPVIPSPPPAARSGGTLSEAAGRIRAAQQIRKSAGNPMRAVEALALLDPRGGDSYMTEADVYEILAGFGLRGVVVQPQVTDTDTLVASTAVSSNVQIVPGMALLVSVSSTGAESATPIGIQYSSPIVVSAMKIGSTNVNNGQSIQFYSFAPGRARAIYEFQERDGTGQTFTATVLSDFVATDVGTVVTTYWDSMDSLRNWLDAMGG